MSGLFVNNNGKILPSDEYVIQQGSRAFLYGDGIFETIRIINGKPINLSNHFSRLEEGAKALKLRIPAYFTLDFVNKAIMDLISKSSISKGGKCRLSLDRTSGGTYLPETNEISYFIEVLPLSCDYFELNTKGVELDIYRAIKKQNNFLSKFKTKNALIYVMASLAAHEKGLDDYIIVNENENILETTNCNLFIVSNGVLYTPSLEDGCLAGTMRMQIINLAIENKIRVYECGITPQNLLTADEILLTNAINGVKWVSGYRTKRFQNDLSKRILNILNEYWKAKLL